VESLMIALGTRSSNYLPNTGPRDRLKAATLTHEHIEAMRLKMRCDCTQTCEKQYYEEPGSSYAARN
jgi:predicted DNA-binding protein (UPF0251 family)